MSDEPDYKFYRIGPFNFIEDTWRGMNGAGIVPGQTFPISAVTQAERDAIWEQARRKPGTGFRDIGRLHGAGRVTPFVEPPRDELFINGRLD